ncbi:MAG: hypothetical protein M3303_13085 [Gemmatimonadota bacterium]|nr:hypothetical protein [Gemmatimonadota bacterium]
MRSTEQVIATGPSNWVLRALPPQKHELIEPRLEHIQLETGLVVIDVNTPIEHVFSRDRHHLESQRHG